ncbi:hemin uptake protein HemP [Vannielia sp.]|nr:hemin uptake protein HemP [Vannielia sp.]MDF1871917.1 hemin uptake protein HemP [Vannielia sp.]
MNAMSPPQQTLPSHDARTLTGGGVQAVIELDGQMYFLRITRAGKLILTK